MPTASESALREASGWSQLARWSADDFPELFDDRPAMELAVVRFHDPQRSLDRLVERWGVTEADPTLSWLARFGASLAEREADAWEADTPDLAMRAFEARRFLFGDRLVHWAVPWLDAVGRCYPEVRRQAHADRDGLLELGDSMRVAPGFGSGEGLTVPGEDSYGPTAIDRDLPEWVRSLWSGALLLDATLRSMGVDPRELRDREVREDLTHLYAAAAGRWRSMASRHPGTEALWLDLARRAETTERWLAESPLD